MTSSLILIRQIGKGGMGEVWEARYTDTAGNIKLVAAKKLNLNDNKLEILKEAQVLSKLDHPNICKYFGNFDLNGETYLLLELIEGKSLEEIINENVSKKYLPTNQEVENILNQLLSAIDYLHNKKKLDGSTETILHRDLSPHNIMIDSNGVLKIIDFGLGKTLSEDNTRTQTTVIKGKHPYISDEVLILKKHSKDSDRYACGVILYEYATSQQITDELNYQIRNNKSISVSISNQNIEKYIENSIVNLLRNEFQRKKLNTNKYRSYILSTMILSIIICFFAILKYAEIIQYNYWKYNNIQIFKISSKYNAIEDQCLIKRNIESCMRLTFITNYKNAILGYNKLLALKNDSDFAQSNNAEKYLSIAAFQRLSLLNENSTFLTKQIIEYCLKDKIPESCAALLLNANNKVVKQTRLSESYDRIETIINNSCDQNNSFSCYLRARVDLNLNNNSRLEILNKICYKAQTESCNILADEMLSKSRFNEGLLYAILSCKQGDQNGCLRIAIVLPKLNIRFNPDFFLRDLCNNGYENVCYGLGMESKKGFFKDEAKEILSKACDLSQAQACSELYTEFYFKNNDYTTPIKKLSLFCEEGFQKACYLLGVAYAKNNNTLGLKKLITECDKYDGSSCYKIADAAISINHKMKDPYYNKAVKLLTIECKFNIDDSCQKLQSLTALKNSAK